jgi:predicted lipoprotein with Yx(FWY)xxD motif
MRNLAGAVLASSAVLLIAACGGSGDESATGSGASSGSSGATVSVKDVSDLGKALVSGDGMTLYTANVEAKGKIHCTGACTSFWKPLEASGTTPKAGGDAGKLSVIKRPDGTMQVTSNGLPLYTFAQDNSGDAEGDGFTDDFDGQHFVWHAVLAGGKPASMQQSAGSSSSGGGYSGGGGDSAGGY